jgi:hypothetical protein
MFAAALVALSLLGADPAPVVSYHWFAPNDLKVGDVDYLYWRVHIVKVIDKDNAVVTCKEFHRKKIQNGSPSDITVKIDKPITAMVTNTVETFGERECQQDSNTTLVGHKWTVLAPMKYSDSSGKATMIPHVRRLLDKPKSKAK